MIPVELPPTDDEMNWSLFDPDRRRLVRGDDNRMVLFATREDAYLAACCWRDGLPCSWQKPRRLGTARVESPTPPQIDLFEPPARRR